MRIYLFSILCLFFCEIAVSQSSIEKIEITPRSKTKGDLTLSQLVESIEYIPLETKDKFLIGRIHHNDISDNYIVVFCDQTGFIYLFKRDGRFICQVGRMGQGPGEYLKNYVGAVFIDEQKQHILVKASNPTRFLFYDFKGKFIRSQVPSETSVKGLFMRYYDKMYFVAEIYPWGEQYKHKIADENLELISQAAKNRPLSRRTVPTIYHPLFPYIYDNQMHVKESMLNDTLYILNKDKNFLPKYLIDAGRYTITDEIVERGNILRWLPDYVLLKGMGETKNYFLLSYSYGSSGNQPLNHFAYYNKQNKKLLYFNSNSGIPNDYDGGFDIWPQRQDENIWYRYYYPHEIEELMEAKENIPVKGPKEAVQAFDRMFKKLDSDDNPVLVILKVKE